METMIGAKLPTLKDKLLGKKDVEEKASKPSLKAKKKEKNAK